MKKSLSIALAFCLAGSLTLGAVPAFAEETPQAQTREVVLDNFDGYGDTAALTAVWKELYALDGDGVTHSITAELNTDGGKANSGKSVKMHYNTWIQGDKALEVQVSNLGGAEDWQDALRLKAWFSSEFDVEYDLFFIFDNNKYQMKTKAGKGLKSVANTPGFSEVELKAENFELGYCDPSTPEAERTFDMTKVTGLKIAPSSATELSWSDHYVDDVILVCTAADEGGPSDGNDDEDGEQGNPPEGPSDGNDDEDGGQGNPPEGPSDGNDDEDGEQGNPPEGPSDGNDDEDDEQGNPPEGPSDGNDSEDGGKDPQYPASDGKSLNSLNTFDDEAEITTQWVNNSYGANLEGSSLTLNKDAAFADKGGSLKIAFDMKLENNVLITREVTGGIDAEAEAFRFWAKGSREDTTVKIDFCVSQNTAVYTISEYVHIGTEGRVYEIPFDSLVYASGDKAVAFSPDAISRINFEVREGAGTKGELYLDSLETVGAQESGSEEPADTDSKPSPDTGEPAAPLFAAIALAAGSAVALKINKKR